MVFEFLLGFASCLRIQIAERQLVLQGHHYITLLKIAWGCSRAQEGSTEEYEEADFDLNGFEKIMKKFEKMEIEKTWVKVWGPSEPQFLAGGPSVSK